MSDPATAQGSQDISTSDVTASSQSSSREGEGPDDREEAGWKVSWCWCAKERKGRCTIVWFTIPFFLPVSSHLPSFQSRPLLPLPPCPQLYARAILPAFIDSFASQDQQQAGAAALVQASDALVQASDTLVQASEALVQASDTLVLVSGCPVHACVQR